MTIARSIQRPFIGMRATALLVIALFAVVMAMPADAARKPRESEKKEAMYPNATREDVKLKTSSRFARQFQRMMDDIGEEKYADAVSIAEEIIAHPKATPGDRALALQNAAYAVTQQDDYEKGVVYVERALQENALSNDVHFQLMRQAAQMRLAEEQFAEGVAHIDRFMEQTGTREAEMLALKGNALYRLERFEEAITVLREAIETAETVPDSWRQLLMGSYFELERPLEAAKIAEDIAARSPNDKRAMLHLSSIYAQADMYDKATEVLENARRRGLLDEERDYRQLYALYFNMEGKENAAIEVIQEGLEKGILKETAEVHVALAQAYYFTDRVPQSIEHYRRAVPLAADGEPGLNLARLLSNEERPAETKAAAQDALKRGVRKPGDAWMIIGRAEHGLNNRAAMIAAYREAAKFPETKEQAEEWLRKNAR